MKYVSVVCLVCALSLFAMLFSTAQALQSAQASTLVNTLKSIDDYCQITLLSSDVRVLTASPKISEKVSITLPEGKNSVRLNCSLTQQAVFSFARSEVLSYTWNDPTNQVAKLMASEPSFVLPVGQFTVDFEIDNHHENQNYFAWQDFGTYVNQSLVNNMTMGAFYGLCLTLMIYVFCLGRILGEKRFELYSIYVFCASTFFLLQEGQLNIFFPAQSFLLSHQLYLLFAGLTVFTATQFIVRLTDLHVAWPKFSLYGLRCSAASVLLISIAVMFMSHNAFSSFLSSVMAYATLAIMLIIFALVIVQTFRKVKMAWLVLLSLFLMVMAMLFRIIFDGVHPILNRYGLIFAFSMEAFMFAIVVSSRIKELKLEKTKAQTDANTDVLCNVLNRRGWEQKAKAYLSYHEQESGMLSLLYIDINDFKQINDTKGHDCGDQVLKIVAQIVQNQLRKEDVVGRIGGDEFVVMGHFDCADEATTQAKRIRERLQHLSINIDGADNVTASASVGHVLFDTPPKSVSKMLRDADKSMYEAKKANKENAVYA